DDDTLRVDAQLKCLRRSPAQALITILDKGCTRYFGGEAVVDRHHDSTEPFQPVEWNIEIGEAVAHHHAAAMQPVNAGRASNRGTRLEDRDRQVGAIGRGDGKV